MGLSLGALLTLHIFAAEKDPANELVPFDAYLALNSPVSYEHAVKQLDAFYNAPRAADGTGGLKVDGIFGVGYTSVDGEIDFDVLPDVDGDESWFDPLVGMRSTWGFSEKWVGSLEALIYALHRRRRPQVRRRQGPFLRLAQPRHRLRRGLVDPGRPAGQRPDRRLSVDALNGRP